jgi:glycosyltransferase involved in cell wall biosynthesis
MPRVNICIPAFNAGKTIGETIKSLLVQTYQNFEIHVSDNASTDNTVEEVRYFKDPRVFIHRNEVNVGGEENFDICLHLGRGKYTAIFHADDIYEPTMLAAQVEFLECNPAAGAVFTHATLIDNNGVQIGQISPPKTIHSSNNLYRFEDVFKAILQHSNFLICPSVLARTQIYQLEMQSWRWDLFGSSADLDMWLRIARRYQIGILPTALMKVRISQTQWSARVRLQPNRADFFRVVDYYLQDNEVRSRLSSSDLNNYLRLARRDNVMRSVNFFLLGDIQESKKLLSDFYSIDTFTCTLQHRRNFAVLVLGTYLRILHLLKLERFGRTTLSLMKSKLRK